MVTSAAKKLEERYNNRGVWKTMRGRRVYIVDGSPVPETDPRKKTETAKKKTETAKKKTETAKKKTETAKKKAAPAKKKAAPAKKKAAPAKKKAAPVKKKTETAKKKAAPVKKKTETAKKKTETAKKKTETAKKKTETAKKKTAPAKKKTETAKKKAAPVKKKTETARKKTETAKKKAAPAKKKAETAKKKLVVSTKKKKKPIKKLTSKETEKIVAAKSKFSKAPFTFPAIVRGKDGDPVLSPKGRKQFKEKKNLTPDEILRDHQGSLVELVARPIAYKYGLQYLQHEHEWFRRREKGVYDDAYGTPQDYFGDIMQEANIGFLHGLNEYAANPEKFDTVKPYTHAINRARQYVSRRMQGLFKDAPLPRRLLTPLSIITQMEDEIRKEKGRSVVGVEMVKELKKKLKGNKLIGAFPLKGADGKDITKLDDKIRALMTIRETQKKQKSLDSSVHLDEEESPFIETVPGETVSAEDILIREEEKKELRGAMKNLLDKVLTEKEKKIVVARYNIGQDSDNLTEFKKIARGHGINESTVKKLFYDALGKLRKEVKKDPKIVTALSRLAISHKSLNDIMFVRTLCNMGLVKSEDFRCFSRRVVGQSLSEIFKSIDVFEYIGSYMRTNNKMTAFVYRYNYDDDLFKAAAEAIKETRTIGNYVRDRKDRYTQLARKQAGLNKERYGDKPLKNVPWSVRLQEQNSGSFWITWNGRKILIVGDGPEEKIGHIIYDANNPLHHEMYHKKTVDPTYHVDEDADYDAIGDHALLQRKERIQNRNMAWKQIERVKPGAGAPGGVKVVGGFIQEWRDMEREKRKIKDNPDALIGNVAQQFPDGYFIIERDGKRYAVEIIREQKLRKRKKYQRGDRYGVSTNLKRIVDLNTGKTVKFGFKGLFDALYPDGDTTNAKTDLMNKTSEIPGDGKHVIEVLDENSFRGLFNETPEGMRENLLLKGFQASKLKLLDEYGEQIVRYTKVLDDGREIMFEVDSRGEFTDPLLDKLIDSPIPITCAADLDAALASAIGNEVWTVAGEATSRGQSHFVKVKFDGQGGPIISEGPFKGKRIQDAGEIPVPEGLSDMEKHDFREKVKKESLFFHGRMVEGRLKLTKEKRMPIRVGNPIMFRDADGIITPNKRKWHEGELLQRAKGIYSIIRLDSGQIIKIPEKNVRSAKGKEIITGSMPFISDIDKEGLMTVYLSPEMKVSFEAAGISVSPINTAKISFQKFEELKEVFGGFSMGFQVARDVEKYYEARDIKKGDRGAKDVGELRKSYDPRMNDDFKEYLNDDSFLLKRNFPGLFDAQIEGIYSALNRNGGKNLLGFTVGTGKTLISIMAAIKKNAENKKGDKPVKNTLVVSPASIRANWVNEVKSHTNIGVDVLSGKTEHGTPIGEKGKEVAQKNVYDFIDEVKKGKVKADGGFTVISQEMFRALAPDGRTVAEHLADTKMFDKITVDEIHNFKTPDGKRHKTLSKVINGFDNAWGLSGTLMDNSPTEIWNQVSLITGGMHDLGTKNEFTKKYCYTGSDGKIAGIKPEMQRELGGRINEFAQFRDTADTGQEYPRIVGQSKFANGFDGNNEYNGVVKTALDYTTIGDKESPVITTKEQKDFYKNYSEMETAVLTASQRADIKAASRTGVVPEDSNYLKAVNFLQQFMNAPSSRYVYTEKVGKNQVSHPYTLSPEGFKLYYKATADGRDYERKPDGSPVTLPPLHYNNPKATQLKDEINDYLNDLEAKNKQRKKAGQPLLPPKLVISSQFLDFGVGVIENVLKEVQRERPYLKAYGTFTGGQSDRDKYVDTFRQLNDKVWAMALSPAGKEGINLENTQKMIHYDQHFNPSVMTQLTGRARRGSSKRAHELVGRENEVDVTSLALPGTIETDIIRLQKQKMNVIRAIMGISRQTEEREGIGLGKRIFGPMLAGVQRKLGGVKKSFIKGVGKNAY